MLVLIILCLVSSVTAKCKEKKERYISGNNTDYSAAKKFLMEHEQSTKKMKHKSAILAFKYQTDMTDKNKKAMMDFEKETAEVDKKGWTNATSFAWKGFKNVTIRRWFKDLSELGAAVLPEKKFKEYGELSTAMNDIYSKGKVCDYKDKKKCDLALDPELTKILAESRDYKELKHVWKAWRDETGRKMKDKYVRYVELGNEAACLNGFPDIGEMWRELYEQESFKKDLVKLWKEIEPFYTQLHAFVRKRLMKKYPKVGIKKNGPIPADLLGDMWAQKWGNIFEICKPYPKKKSIDVTENMKKQNYTVERMFKMAEEFFTSIGLPKMTKKFWKNSVFVKPEGKEVVCHASAWDTHDGEDFRIKMCTEIKQDDFRTVHHEMGHVEYYMLYAHQPGVFRGGANPGFHEAVGDTIALSVSTEKHLKKVGLLDKVQDDNETDINNLLQMALDKIAFLPYGYLHDLWRWKVFSGEVDKDKYNQEWWSLRLNYQGLCPPVPRTEKDLDPAAKYHVPAHVPYIRYFVSFIIQFQFHKALCNASGHEGPLHKCDIYQSKEAGKKFSEMLKLGSSKHWTKAFKMVTGVTKMDVGPLMEYFKPLVDWLEKENKDETPGWESDDPMKCP